MINKIKRDVLLAFLVSAALVCPLSAQSETDQMNEKSSVSVDPKTREDIIEEIKSIAMEDREIFERVPGFKTKKVEGEKEIFVYFDGEQEIKLKDLADDDLEKLFEQVTAAKERLDDEWRRQSIEAVKQAQERPPRPPELPPRLPPQLPPRPPKR